MNIFTKLEKCFANTVFLCPYNLCWPYPSLSEGIKSSRWIYSMLYRWNWRKIPCVFGVQNQLYVIFDCFSFIQLSDLVINDSKYKIKISLCNLCVNGVAKLGKNGIFLILSQISSSWGNILLSKPFIVKNSTLFLIFETREI